MNKKLDGIIEILKLHYENLRSQVSEQKTISLMIIAMLVSILTAIFGPIGGIISGIFIAFLTIYYYFVILKPLYQVLNPLTKLISQLIIIKEKFPSKLTPDDESSINLLYQKMYELNNTSLIECSCLGNKLHPHFISCNITQKKLNQLILDITPIIKILADKLKPSHNY